MPKTVLQQPAPSSERGGQRRETAGARLDLEHEQLFHELRAVIPGAQVPIAFLLSVAFTERFQRLTDVQRGIHLTFAIWWVVPLQRRARRNSTGDTVHP